MTRKEFNQCVQEYSDRVFGFALKNMGSKDDAQDIVQEAFERMWLKHQEIDSVKGKSYLFSTAYHCIIDHHRKVKRMADFPVEEQKIGSFDSALDNKQWIDEGLRNMTEQERSLILLRDYEGYSYDELKNLTGLSLSQVKVYLFRARKKFKNWLVAVNKINKVI